MIAPAKPAMLFNPGKFYMTPGILPLKEEAETEIKQAIGRHLSGDWGDLDEEDTEANWNSLKDGSRLLSAYHIRGVKIWIITEAEDDDGNRTASTLMLPEEY